MMKLKTNFDEIKEQGFGELVNGCLELAPFEELYLVEKEKVKGDFKELLRKLKKKEKLIDNAYAVFKDLRIAGYVCRDAKLKTPCFRVYARGSRPGEEPSRYLVWVLSSKDKFSKKELGEMVEKAHAVRKRPVFAFVEKGSITYFKVDSTQF